MISLSLSLPSERSVSPLASCETGPLLLVLPTREDSDITDDDDNNRWSYDAWFLWKPEAIDSSVFVKLKAEGLQFADDCGRIIYTIAQLTRMYIYSHNHIV